MTKPPILSALGIPKIDPPRRPDPDDTWQFHSEEPWREEIDDKIPEMKLSVYAALGKMDHEVFDGITSAILDINNENQNTDIETGPHVAQVEAYTRFILDNIDEKIFSLDHDALPEQTATEPGTPVPNEETLLKGKHRLTILCALVHDIHKRFKGNSLVTHAFESAREITTGKLFSNLFGSYISPVDIKALSLLTSRIIETHSSIPFINDNLLNTQMRGTLPHITKETKEDAPQLMFRLHPGTPGIIDMKMPEPEDIIGQILRMADGLSNYGVFPNLEIVLLGEKTKIQMIYAGFIKIAGLTENGAISDRIGGMITSAKAYIDQGLYDGVPVAEEIAEISISAMECLQLYFTKGKGKTVNHVGLYTGDLNDPDAEKEWRNRLSEELEKALVEMESNTLDLLP